MAVLKVYDDTRGRGQCRSCEAPIWWFQLTSGKRHPFNASGADGPVYIRTEREASTSRLVGYIDTSINTSHFQTCPQSAEWKRR
jgi:hypothetical protein